MRVLTAILQIAHNRISFEGKLPNISWRNFVTLGPRQWLDDEVINYFVTRWCSGSLTLGLNTFFACKILFEDLDNSCINAKHGVLTSDDAQMALRWCHRAKASSPLVVCVLT